jgi:hypothetical protein
LLKEALFMRLSDMRAFPTVAVLTGSLCIATGVRGQAVRGVVITPDSVLVSGVIVTFAIRSGQFEILDQPALADRSIIYSLFTEAARTGTPLSRDAERSIAYVVSHSELEALNQAMSWDTLKEILAADYPGMALRPMHRLGILMEILPEMRAIDSLVAWSPAMIAADH